MSPTSVTPAELADLIAVCSDRGIVAFDVDGVLAPIVAHADESVLLAGSQEHLASLARRTEVAIVSGRSLENLEEQFGFASGIHVIGSHGLEERHARMADLTDDERFTFEQLEIIGIRAVTAAGDGAWLEYKPASVVVHVREANEELAPPALDAATRLASTIVGAHVKAGSSVIELLARTASKGDALLTLARRLGRRPLVYFGDDVTDEDAFVVMADDDISVKVGPGESAARFRLDGPDAVALVLQSLASD